MKCKALIALVLFFVCLNLPAQDSAQIRLWQDSAANAKADSSKINYLRHLANAFVNNRPDSAAAYCRQAIAFSRKIGWLKGEAQNLLNLGVAFANASKFDSAILIGTQALAASIRTGDSNRIALVYINRGTAYTETYDFEKALADLNLAMKIAEATGNQDRQARAAESLSEFYTLQEKYTAALPWQLKAYSIQQSLADSEQMMISQLNLGAIYTKTNSLSLAEASTRDALGNAGRFRRDDIFIECALTMSEIFSQRKQPDSAIAILSQALGKAEKLNIVDREGSLCTNLGNSWALKKEYSRALVFFSRGANLVKADPGFRKTYYECLYGQAESLAGLGRFDEAYRKSVEGAVVKDRFLLATQNERTARLQTQFETERRESEISLLHKDKELAGLELQRQRSIRLAIVVSFVLVLGIVLLLIARYRVIQRNRRLMEMDRLRQSISRDLHDDMGSTLSSIHINSKVALDQSDNPELVRDRLDKIRTNAGNMMQGMQDIVWAINPVNDSWEKLVLRLKQFCIEMLEPLDIAVHFEDTVQNGTPIIGLEKRKEIFLICKETINNCAKHSRAQNAWITFQTRKDKLSVLIRDDGRGFESRKPQTGNGLKNLVARVGLLKGQLFVESVPGAGCKVSIIIPIP